MKRNPSTNATQMLNSRICVLFILCAFTVMGLSFGNGVFAQTYPNKPIRIIVPFSAGSGSDVFARTLGPKFTETWGQPVVVENREGAGGVIGAQVVAKAAP